MELKSWLRPYYHSARALLGFHRDICTFNEFIVRKYKSRIRGAIQVGAHQGLEYPWFQGIKELLFFEPLPSCFKILEQNVGAEVRLVQAALGSFRGKVKMYVESSNKGQSSSVLAPDEHQKLYPWIEFDQRVEVPQFRLDDYLEEHGLKGKYNFLEIDVQGYELEVLKGAERILGEIDFIYCEVNRTSVYKGCSRVEEVDEFLARFGFRRQKTVWVEGTEDAFGDAFYTRSIWKRLQTSFRVPRVSS